MDASSVLSDRQLLLKLSKEYELLKLSGGNVDFDAWIKQRLREAAAQKLLAPVQTRTTESNSKSHSGEVQRLALQPIVNSGPQTSHGLRMLHGDQLGFSRRIPAFQHSKHFVGTSSINQRGNDEQQGLQVFGEGPGKDVLLGSDNTIPGRHHVSRPPGAGAAGPILRAATERERRLALSTALARQQLAAGGAEVRERDLEIQSSEYQHVLQLVQRLARQNDDLSQQVQQMQQLAKPPEKAPATEAHGGNDDENVKPDTAQALVPPPGINRAAHAQSQELPWFVRAAGQGGPISPRRAGRALSPPKAGLGGRGSPDRRDLMTDRDRKRRIRKDHFKLVLRQLLEGASTGEDAWSGAKPAGLPSGKPRGKEGEQSEAGARKRWFCDGPKQPHSDESRLRAAFHKLSSLAAGEAGGSQASQLQGARLQRRDQQGRLADEPSEKSAPRREVPRAQRPGWHEAASGPLLQRDARSLEEEVQRIVLADAAKEAEQSRVKNLQGMEDRMSKLISRMELAVTHSSSSSHAHQPAANEAQQQQQAPDPGVGVVELQRMLMALQHMENKEKQMRHKWFSGGTVQGPAVLSVVVKDGLISSVFPPTEGPEPGRTPPRPLHSSGDKISVAAGSKAPQHIPGIELSAEVLEPVGAELLEKVLHHRDIFLRRREVRDGDLVSSGLPVLGATEVVEDVTDLLIEELLHEHAMELATMCDSMGDQLFDGEFNDPLP